MDDERMDWMIVDLMNEWMNGLMDGSKFLTLMPPRHASLRLNPFSSLHFNLFMFKTFLTSPIQERKEKKFLYKIISQ